MKPLEMTNLYMSAWPNDPIIRAAVMQSSDSTSNSHPIRWSKYFHSPRIPIRPVRTASQPQWEVNDQLNAISQNFFCPTGKGELDCLRKQSATDLQRVLLDTGNQFQPVIDNITVFKDYVKQTKEGRTARIPLLVGTNKVGSILRVSYECLSR